MADTKIRALTAFSDGTISMYENEIADVEATKASGFIADGLAVEFTEPIVPSGTIEIIANDTYDVTTKASAVVNVPEPTGSQTITANGTYDIKDKASVEVNVSIATVTYDVNGGEGTVSAVTAIKGNSIVLNDGTGIEPPSGKTFSGWGTSSTATETLESPYTVTADVTLYAVYSE